MARDAAKWPLSTSAGEVVGQRPRQTPLNYFPAADVTLAAAPARPADEPASEPMGAQWRHSAPMMVVHPMDSIMLADGNARGRMTCCRLLSARRRRLADNKRVAP